MTVPAGMIKSVISKHRGLARPNQYRVILPVLPNLDVDASDLDVLCRATGVPGKNINSATRKTGALGRDHATDFEIENVTMTFTETANSFIRNYFDHWMDLIIHPITHVVEFKDKYAKSIEIRTYNNAGVDAESPIGEEAVTLLVGCWPKTRPTVNYADSERDSNIEISIDFSVDDYQTFNRDQRLRPTRIGQPRIPGFLNQTIAI